MRKYEVIAWHKAIEKWVTVRLTAENPMQARELMAGMGYTTVDSVTPVGEGTQAVRDYRQPSGPTKVLTERTSKGIKARWLSWSFVMHVGAFMLAYGGIRFANGVWCPDVLGVGAVLLLLGMIGRWWANVSRWWHHA